MQVVSELEYVRRSTLTTQKCRVGSGDDDALHAVGNSRLCDMDCALVASLNKISDQQSNSYMSDVVLTSNISLLVSPKGRH